jgi:hypothetical protein
MSKSVPTSSSSGLIPPYLLSPVDFNSTEKAVLVQHAANLVILPAYVTAVVLVLRSLLWMDASLPPADLGVRVLLGALCVALAAVPIVLDLFAPLYWRALNRPRVGTVVAGALLPLLWQGWGQMDAAASAAYLVTFVLAVTVLVRDWLIRPTDSRWFHWLANVVSLLVAGIVLVAGVARVSSPSGEVQQVSLLMDAIALIAYLATFALAVTVLVRGLIIRREQGRWLDWLANVVILLMAGIVIAAGVTRVISPSGEGQQVSLLMDVIALIAYLATFALAAIVVICGWLKLNADSRWLDGLANVVSLLVPGFLLVVGFVLLQVVLDLTGSPALEQPFIWIVLLCVVGYACCALPLATISHRTSLDGRSLSRFIMNWRDFVVACVVFVIAALVCVASALAAPEDTRGVLFGLLGLLLLLFSAFPRLFLSEQSASLRHMLRRQREGRLLSRISPFVQPRGVLALARDIWIPRLLSPENRTMAVLACLLVGGVGVPVVLHVLVNLAQIPDQTMLTLFGLEFTLKSDKPLWFLAPTDLLLIGLISTGVLLLVYSLWYAAFRRDRYVITDFGIQTARNDDRPYMEKVAAASRRMLIDELQTTGALLKQRQIENVNFVREDSNALFVTTGLDVDFFDQIQEVVTVEVGSTGRAIDFSRLSQFLVRLLARIRISGGAQRHDDGSIELFVTMRFRSRTSPMFVVRMDPPPGGGDLDDAVIRQCIRELALRLLIALEQVPGCGDSWQALDHFLLGLHASSGQNWWQAIAHYHRTLEASGEAQHARFGLVYYHLGSALVHQGRWEEGREMLLKAEAFGPAMPETQYMLALTALYTFWGQLHESETVMKEIETRCQTALRMRRHFPEAAHILGTAYYRRGRLIDRGAAEKKKESSDNQAGNRTKETSSSPQGDYFRATNAFWRALRQYDRTLSRSQRGSRVIGLKTADSEAFSRQRIVVAHQLGDALRGVGKLAEADQFYLDMHAVQRGNIRNISDMLKTYCLGQSWQRAQEFLYRVAKMYEPARWDSDVMIHAGWLTSGGALTVSDERKRRGLALKAFQYLDYAIYTRPRTAKAWRQTDWRKPFDQLIDTLVSSDAPAPNASDRIDEPDKGGIHIRDARMLKAWIDWRVKLLEWIEGVATTEPEKSETEDVRSNRVRGQKPKTEDDRLLVALMDLSDVSTYCTIAGKAAAFERRIQDDRLASGVERLYERSKLAREAYEAWKNASDQWGTPGRDNHPPALNEDKKAHALTFKGRAEFEVYVLLSLLTARLLADAHRYVPLTDMAGIVTHDMDAFRAHWMKENKLQDGSWKPGDESHFTFSAQVFRFQFAAMRAWYAYGLLHHEHNLISRQVSKVLKDDFKSIPSSRTECLKLAREQIEQARKEVPVHPLVLLVRAQLLNEDGLRLQAIQELKTLLDVIDPFDPKRDAVGSSQDGTPSPTSTESRSYRYFIERVAGRQQFACVANPVALCQLMAEYARDIESDAATSYLNEAVRRSSFRDVDFELFERLGSKFNRLERYDDALAVASAMRLPLEEIRNARDLGVRRFAPDVMEAEAYSRKERYAQAREKARSLAGRLRIPVEYIEECWPDPRQVAQASPVRPHHDRFRSLTRRFADYYSSRDAHEVQRQAIDSFNQIVTLDPPLNRKVAFAEGMRKIIEQMSRTHALPTSTNGPLRLSPLFTRLNAFAGDDDSRFGNKVDVAGPRAVEFWGNDDKKGNLYYGLNHLAEAVLYVHDMPTLRTFLNNRYRDDNNHFALSEMARTVIEHGRQARAGLIYLSDVLNTLAYTRAMMRLSGPDFAYLDSALAIYILTYLYKTCDRTHREHDMLSSKLAQACDTYGWVQYYGERPTLETLQSSRSIWQVSEKLRRSLEKSEKALRQGLQYRHDRPIIRYHLAYLHLDAAELLLDARSPADRRGAYADNVTVLIKQYLEAAENELTEAGRIDQNGRLRHRIIRLNAWLKALKEQAKRQAGAEVQARPG